MATGAPCEVVVGAVEAQRCVGAVVMGAIDSAGAVGALTGGDDATPERRRGTELHRRRMAGTQIDQVRAHRRSLAAVHRFARTLREVSVKQLGHDQNNQCHQDCCPG